MSCPDKSPEGKNFISTYTVTLTANNGCTAGTATHTVTVADVCDPITGVDFTWLPVSPVEGEDVSFTSSMETGDGTITYAWDFDDGGTSSNPHPTHVFANGGVFNISLTATNDCSISNRITPVTIRSLFDLYLPAIVR